MLQLYFCPNSNKSQSVCPNRKATIHNPKFTDLITKQYGSNVGCKDKEEKNKILLKKKLGKRIPKKIPAQIKYLASNNKNK